MLPTLAGVAVAAAALVILVRAARGTGAPAPDTGVAAAILDGPPAEARTAGPGSGRRRFLLASAGAAAAAAAAGGIGDLLLRRFSVSAARAQVQLPGAATTAPPVSSGTELQVSGLSSFYTPNASFYRVDTDLVLPFEVGASGGGVLHDQRVVLAQVVGVGEQRLADRAGLGDGRGGGGGLAPVRVRVAGAGSGQPEGPQVAAHGLGVAFEPESTQFGGDGLGVGDASFQRWLTRSM